MKRSNVLTKNLHVRESLIKLSPDHAGPNAHHLDSPNRHRGNPAQIGNGSQIFGNGLGAHGLDEEIWMVVQSLLPWGPE